MSVQRFRKKPVDVEAYRHHRVINQQRDGRMKLRVVLAAAVFAGFAAYGGMASAPADAAPCEHRSAAHVAEHGGLAADSAYHVSHGELPTCNEERKTSSDTNNNKDKSKSDGKSRYCRKHFFC